MKTGLSKPSQSFGASGRKTLLPFITAGFPDAKADDAMRTTAAMLEDFQRRGVRICELGVPFSDPVADGPVIQASYTALAAGVTSDKIFEMVRNCGMRIAECGLKTEKQKAPPPPVIKGIRNPQSAISQLAIIAMVSYSIVFRQARGIHPPSGRGGL